jgi:hypothetical protein
MKKFFAAILAWMLAHPVIEHFLEGGIYAIIAGVLFYIKGGLATNAGLTWAGLGAAALLAAKAWFNLSKGQILAWLQDVVQNQAALTPPNAASSTPVPSSAALTPLVKAMFLAMGLGLLAMPVNAGYLLSAPSASERMTLSLPSGTGLYLLPIEGFQVGASLPQPTYGLSFNEDLVFGGQTIVNGVKNLAPYFGVGLSLYLDTAGVINGDGPLECLGGVNILGPDLDLIGSGNGTGLVPNVLLTYNFATGESKVTGGLTVFANLFPGAAQQVAGN